jgi:hypothetical protein
VRSLGDSFSQSFGESWGTEDAAAAATTDGPWRLLSGDYPKPRPRDVIVWPGDAIPVERPAPIAPPPPAPRAERELALRLVIQADSPFIDLVAPAGAVVSRGTLPARELALVLLLAA